ncbi:replication-relaxation family protein [Priestia aryabhattai]|uniref:replication-relaxation family protein n=1 Tax=Priestia aryabhattai TaxID=412384 RepID=UPI003D2899EC
MSDIKEKKESKPILLQKRDQIFLLHLYDLQFLDVEYLQNNLYKNSKAFVYRRMKSLEEEGYIQSFRVPILELNNGQSKNVYALGKRGANEVKALLGEVDWRYDIVSRTPSHIYHQLLLAHVRAAFDESFATNEEEQVPKHETYTLAQYLNEKRGYFKYDPKEYVKPRVQESFSIRPDGVLILKNKKTERYQPFFIELERSYQSKETTMKKLERYNSYCQLELYKEEHRAYDYPVGKPRVLFISYKENGVDRLLDHSKNVDTSATAGVLYTTYEEIINGPYEKIFYAKDSSNPDQTYSLVSKVE